MVIAHIHECYNKLPEELKRAARWIVDHPTDACFLSMREQARRAEVVAPTMIRLAKALGFNSFRTLQEELRSYASWGTANYSVHAQKLQAEATKTKAITDTTSHLTRLESLQYTNLNALSSLNPPESFERVATHLLNAKTTVFLGFRSSHSIALHAHYLHQMLVGRGMLLDDRYGMLTDVIEEFDHETVVFIVSLAPYSRQIVESAQRATERNAILIALTDSELSPLAQLSQETLLFPAASNSFFHSLVAAHALVERVMAEIAVRGGDTIVSHLHKREAALAQSNTYWKNEPKRKRLPNNTKSSKKLFT